MARMDLMVMGGMPGALWPPLLLTLCLATACGSGSGSDPVGSLSIDDSEAGNTPGSSQVLSGEFLSVSESNRQPVKLDFATGHYSAVPGLQWEWGEHEYCKGPATFTAYPSRDGELLVEAVDQCNSGEEAFERTHSLFIRDRQGRVLDRVDITTSYGGIYGPARISPDGSMIALRVNFGAGSEYG